MDIDVDISTPRDDLFRDSSGKYRYRIEGDRFEIDRFNRDFDQYKERRKQEMRKRMDQRLSELNKPAKEVPIYKKPVGEIMIKTKDTLFNILDDLLRFRFELETFTKNSRMFYIGILILFIALMVFIYTIFTKPNGRSDDISVGVRIEKVEPVKTD